MVLNTTFNKISLMEETTDLPKVTDKNILKIPKGQSQSVNRKTYNTKSKRKKVKGRNKDLQNTAN